MKVLKEAKIKDITVTEDGKGYVVVLDDGNAYTLGKKALWGWGRLQEGRKSFDTRVQAAYAQMVKNEGLDPQTIAIQDQIRLKRAASSQAFGETYLALGDQRPFQAITKKKQLLSVASLKHILLDPGRVKEIGAKVFSSLGVDPWFTHPGIIKADQLLGKYGEHNGLNLGLSFSAGNIYTQRAISISQMIELQDCTNALVWLGGLLSSYCKGSSLRWRTRILRLEGIQDEKVLEKRIFATVKDVQSGEKGLIAVIEGSKTKLLTVEMAGTILKAFSSSYGIGEKVQGEIMSEYQEGQGKSVYDLSQATSHIAWSSEKMRQDATRARSTLTGIAAVMTTIKNPKETFLVCKQRLEAKAQA